MAAVPIHDPTRAPLADARRETCDTTCYMCACRCGIRVHLRDGEVRYIDGNPEHPHSRGNLCPRGQSGLMNTYDPDRVLTPLIRVKAEKGMNRAPRA